MSAGYGRGGGKVVHSMTLEERARYHMTMLCATLGCDAIVGRVMWSAGNQTIVAKVAVGAAEGDVQKLQRLPLPEPPV